MLINMNSRVKSRAVVINLLTNHIVFNHQVVPSSMNYRKKEKIKWVTTLMTRNLKLFYKKIRIPPRAVNDIWVTTKTSTSVLFSSSIMAKIKEESNEILDDLH